MSIPFPSLDERKIRADAVRDLLNRLDRAHRKVASASKTFGQAIGERSWKGAGAASDILIDRMREWDALILEARETFAVAAEDLAVVHDTGDATGCP